MTGKVKMRSTRKFWQATEGLAAVEFAFILPVMVIMFLGLVETSNYVTTARRVASVASTGADLAAPRKARGARAPATAFASAGLRLGATPPAAAPSRCC
jgi:Flp pilus assembly protein TadG